MQGAWKRHRAKAERARWIGGPVVSVAVTDNYHEVVAFAQKRGSAGVLRAFVNGEPIPLGVDADSPTALDVQVGDVVTLALGKAQPGGGIALGPKAFVYDPNGLGQEVGPGLTVVLRFEDDVAAQEVEVLIEKCGEDEGFDEYRAAVVDRP